MQIGETVADAIFLSRVKSDTNGRNKKYKKWFREPKSIRQQKVTVAVRTVVHPNINVDLITSQSEFPRNFCTIEDGKKLMKCGVFELPVSEHDVILDEIARRDEVEFERQPEGAVE